MKTVATPDQTKTNVQSEWKQGDVVELTGKIHPARTEAKYFIETDDGQGISIKIGLLHATNRSDVY